MPEMQRVESLRAVANRHPWLKSALKTLARPFRPTISSAYARVVDGDRDRLVRDLKGAWQSPQIPSRQRAGVNRQLAAYRNGAQLRSLDVLVDMLSTLRSPTHRLSLLEVGCSSGYHAEAFAVKGVEVDYAGCDYSTPFIELARQCYPALDFRVSDATALAYSDANFDLVLSGCCLLHIPDYEAAICEAARVARTHVIFHRTPVLHQMTTQYFTKKAYGVQMLEIHFNEHELVSLFARHGLCVVDIATLDASWRRGDAYATKTYLCRKIGHG